MKIRTHRRARYRWRSAGSALALIGGLAVASYTGINRAETLSSTPPAAALTVAAKITIKTASVPGLGTVLVDGAGRTLYSLTSESSGKITCTAASGCPTYWPQIRVRSGQRHQAREGAKAGLVRSEKGASGTRILTYHGHPLYTYSGDDAAGQSLGEGLKSYGGTWYAVSASGSLVKSSTSSSTPSTGSGGY
ncbi:MAG: COG4315 family predicted lipoprotein [Candidatus Dormibacteria bacterium]